MDLGDSRVQKTSSGLLLGTCFTACHTDVAVPVLQGGKRGSHLPLRRGLGGTETLLTLPCLHPDGSAATEEGSWAAGVPGRVGQELADLVCVQQSR